MVYPKIPTQKQPNNSNQQTTTKKNQKTLIFVFFFFRYHWYTACLSYDILLYFDINLHMILIIFVFLVWDETCLCICDCDDIYKTTCLLCFDSFVIICYRMKYTFNSHLYRNFIRVQKISCKRYLLSAFPNLYTTYIISLIKLLNVCNC